MIIGHRQFSHLKDVPYNFIQFLGRYSHAECTSDIIGFSGTGSRNNEWITVEETFWNGSVIQSFFFVKLECVGCPLIMPPNCFEF